MDKRQMVKSQLEQAIDSAKGKYLASQSAHQPCGLWIGIGAGIFTLALAFGVARVALDSGGYAPATAWPSVTPHYLAVAPSRTVPAIPAAYTSATPAAYVSETLTDLATGAPAIAATATPAGLEIIEDTPAPQNIATATPTESGPAPQYFSVLFPGRGAYRQRSTASLGTGSLAQGELSDGMAPFSEDYLWQHDLHHLQRLRAEEQPSGCAVAQYDTDEVWFGASAARAGLVVNGISVGRLDKPTGKQGYLFKVNVKAGDTICTSDVGSYGYQIVLGPDVDVHYDSYCYRGGC